MPKIGAAADTIVGFAIVIILLRASLLRALA
jgi:hypothetical protein